MEHCDLVTRCRGRGKAALKTSAFASTDAASGSGPIESGVHANEPYFLISQGGLQLLGEVSTEGGEGDQRSLPDPIEGHVMVAGDCQGRASKALNERECLTKLLGLGALGEISGKHDKVRPSPFDERNDAFGPVAKVFRPEVNVRYVEQLAQTCEAARSALALP